MNQQHLRLAALIGAAMALACPLQARAAADDLVIRTMGPVSYVCGGVAEDERQALAAREKDFNIGILFTQGAAGEFLSDVAVKLVRDEQEVADEVEETPSVALDDVEKRALLVGDRPRLLPDQLEVAED